MHDMGEDQLRLCYSEFRKHYIQRHDLQEWDTTPHVHLDLENWLLTLNKNLVIESRLEKSLVHGHSSSGCTTATHLKSYSTSGIGWRFDIPDAVTKP
jgi:hypothetical protein